ncbi:DNA (cytosine-5-)-methyltransferase, partial [Zostera marina]
MESSEDEGELRETQSVNNYHFVDENEEPICFSILPFQWEEGQSMEICKKEIFLHGVGDDGLQIIYRQVIAWKLNLECFQAEISVLTKTMKWIMLRKPRASFLDTIRKMMITIQSIHYLKRNHNSTEKSLWHHVRKFSSFEVRASPYDILDNASFVRRMMKRDDTLAKSELLDKLLTTTSKKANASSEGLMIKKTSDFIDADDRNSMDEEAGDNGEDSDDLDCFDSVCAICDNGGELLCCEGKCLRSFHAFKEPGSNCKTLGFTRAEVKAIQNYKCWNCCSEKHQCFSCGKLGSSNLSNPEVFQCANATCGYFFHPKCVAKLLHCENKTEATDLEKNISFGQKFVCPFHKCLVCKGKEDKLVEDLQFAICRRCPTSYHRKCLPRTIAFEESEDGDIIQRAWDDLIPNRILIYCTKHAIDKKLGTPIRNHIILYEDLSKNKDTFLEPDKQKSWVKRKDDPLDIERYSITAEKKKPKLEQSGFMVRKDKAALSQGKGKETKNKASSVDGNKLHVREKPKSLVKENREIPNSTRNHSSLPIGTIFPKMPSASDVNKNRISPSIVDSETQKRILALVRKSESKLPSFENYIKKLSTPTTHSYSARLVEFVDKSITLGKVEGAMEAVQTALQNINEDDVESIENAKDVCEPEFLYQIMKWKNKLSVYLSPFLHGKLYTSFGRHFTKKEKLMEIVDKLHCYVESGDMIVDFCCGANDFSILMKEKLEATGKKCNYRNYDVMPPK